ncbi:MAG: trypsin-like serine protease [Pseudonocardiaceae bacterium]|nr:trypsin-like serine protease [Pseudonocardiaceae bacterium]
MGTRLPALRTVIATAAALMLSASGQIASAIPYEPPSGAAEPRIVGGKQSSINEHPYAVYLTTADGMQFCGGTLVEPDKVVTAAHCAAAQPAEDLRVVAGREDKQATDGHDVGVEDIWLHPEFEKPSEGADVAVLTLSEALPYRTLATATEQDSRLYAEGTQATILGWGRMSEGGDQSRYLRSATVPLVSDEECGRAFGNYDPRAMVCAGYPEGGTDACQGDSGGPLITGGRLIGIVSWGEGCALPGKPGVYTRVSNYARDINAEIGR